MMRLWWCERLTKPWWETDQGSYGSEIDINKVKMVKGKPNWRKSKGLLEIDVGEKDRLIIGRERATRT